MKRFFISILVWLMLVVLVIPSFVSTVSAAEKTVKTESQFLSALSSAADGDTIKVTKTITFSGSFVWKELDKNIKVIGDSADRTIDFSAIDNLTFGTGVTFESITLKFKSGGNVFANGKKVTIAESVTVENTVTMYGGKNGGTLNGDTDLTLMSGVYSKIYGGSKGGTINGSTHLTVSGKVNEGVTWTNHGGSVNIYGGGNGCVINGDTNLTVNGNALANYIFGGSEGSGSKISGRSSFTFGGNAKAMSLYGSSNKVNTGNDVTLTMNGGEVQQVFGGVQGESLGSASKKVEVKVNLLGGKITRRVYGGCYNEYTEKLVWEGSYNVFGNIIVTLGKNVNITLDYTEKKEIFGFPVTVSPDTSFFARSRRQSKAADETAIIIYLAENATDTASGSAYKTYSGKIGLGGITPGIDRGVTPMDEEHIMYYTSDATSISEKCILSGCNHSAKITLSRSVSDASYTGSAIEFANVSTDAAWKSGKLDKAEYSNNINAGKASFSLECVGKTLTLECDIKKAAQKAPSLTKTDETVKGKADGKIAGLSLNMEYATNKSGPYRAVTDVNMDFAVGTYFVRVKGDANRENSKPTEITISEGGKVKLTFVIDGATVAERELAWNETLTDIPEIPERDGYTAMWSVTNFTNISRDKTVTAIYTKIGETPVIPDEELPEGDESSGTLPGGDENGSENKDTERATESEKTTQTDMDAQTSTDTDASAPTESGCGASAFGGVAAIISVAVGFAVFKKKED